MNKIQIKTYKIAAVVRVSTAKNINLFRSFLKILLNKQLLIFNILSLKSHLFRMLNKKVINV